MEQMLKKGIYYLMIGDKGYNTAGQARTLGTMHPAPAAAFCGCRLIGACMAFCLLLTINIHIIPAEELFQIGTSFTGKDIDCYSFGNGEKCIIVIGGIHGRYEESTVFIADRLIAYCREYEDKLKANIKIVKNLNPDSFRYELDDPVVKANGSIVRFNGNKVDLNRNWNTPNWQKDCRYSSNYLQIGVGGNKPMSEPEVKGLADLLINSRNNYQNIYVITLHSYVVNIQKENSVFPSYIVSKDKKIEIPEDADRLAGLFSQNGNFRKSNIFQYYDITGELLNWCGINGIAAVDIEFSDNGNIDAKHFNKKSHWENFIECFEYFLENIR
jgi:hypothetical protein